MEYDYARQKPSWDLVWRTLYTAMLNITCYPRLWSSESISSRGIFFEVWGLAMPMVAVTFLTLMTNGTVLLMFILTRLLRKCKNIYIFNLAMADFFIGCTMLIAMLQDLNPDWALEGGACKLSLTIRHSLLYVSLLSILLISVDRWWSINYPFSYRVRQSRTLAICAACLCWFLSFTLHIPPIILWDLIADPGVYNSSSQPALCNVPYSKHFVFVLTASTLEYLIPIIGLWGLNCSIYLRISGRKSMKIRRSLSASETLILTCRKSSSESDCTMNPSDESADLLQNSAPRQDFRRTSLIMNCSRRHSIANYLAPPRPTLAPNQCSRNSTKRRVSFDTLMGQQANRPSTARTTPICRKPSTMRKQSDELVRDLFVKQDKKAACSLGLLVLVFTICWTPYMMLSVVDAKCSSCLPDWAPVLTLWVLMTNSAINPFLYGLLNAEIRNVLRHWFFCPKRQKYNVKEALLQWNLQQGLDSDVMRANGYFPVVRE